MIRSLFAFAAAAWFGYNVFGYESDVESVALAVRMLCVGLALASLALVDWDWVSHPPASATAPAADENG